MRLLCGSHSALSTIYGGDYSSPRTFFKALPFSIASTNYCLWVAVELAMIATDMAEMIGAAIGFQLVRQFPLWIGAILAAVSSFALLGIRTALTKGYRVIEFVIMALLPS